MALRRILVLCLFSVFAFFSCVKNNELPVFIELNTFTLLPNSESVVDPGYLSHRFTNATVYVDDKLIGVFELPCKIPVLAKGTNVSIRVYPTILNDGQVAKKKIYPFVMPYETSMDLNPGETYVINPSTKYYKTVKFWIEDFDQGTVKLTENPNYTTANMNVESLANISLSDDYGHIHFTDQDSSWVATTTGQDVQLEKGGESYLEIDYRISVPIETGVKAIGLDGSASERVVLSFASQNPGEETWKKIYVDLKNTVSYMNLSAYFQQYFKAYLPSSQSQGDIYIDNIKIVRF